MEGVELLTAAKTSSSPGAMPAVEALRLRFEAEYAPRVNFAMQQNGVPLIERITLTNESPQPLEAVTVTAALESGECEPWTARIERIEPGGAFHLEPSGLGLRAGGLAARTEAQRTAIILSAEAGGARARKSLPIDLLPYDQWPGIGLYPELLAAFCTPNHPAVAELLQAARRSLGQISGQDGIDGYQSGSRQRAAQIAEACFNAACAAGIGYINPPASFDRDGQRVRLVDRVLRERLASCLDLSLLFASLWEQAGLHPLVLLVEGHAMPAVWTRESHLPEPAIDEAARIRNLIELGDVVPVEATFVTQAPTSFAGAVEAAKRRMAAPGAGFCAVDICTCRKKGVRPLPLRVGGEGGLDLTGLEQAAISPAGSVLDPVALAERADGAASTGPTVLESGVERIERWKRHLLDLSLRNRLINFRETAKTLRLLVPDVAQFENQLAAGDRFAINAITDGNELFLRQQLTGGHIYSDLPPGEHEQRLLQLFRIARSSIEETGANLLHVAIGMLRWFETPSSQVPRFAPLLLLPVTLHRRSAGSGYRYDVSLSDEPLRPNVTLLEKLRVEFGIQTGGLAELPEDESGVDLPLMLRRFREAIRETRWEVEEAAYIGLFSFNKFLMWRDLQENMDKLRRSRLVNHLVDREHGAFDPNPLPQPDGLDDELAPGELLCTRDADSSQLAAIRAAADGRSFVLEGPPGTGKSQTIANIIADSLARQKRVLFVAEKMAALSVVRKRLEEDGLGPFCLELHSAKASKKEVLLQLEAALRAPPAKRPADWEQLCSELGATRQQLNAYVREMHRLRASGQSIYQVLGRLVLLGDGPRATTPEGTGVGTTAQQLAVWREHVRELVENSEPVDPPGKHALRGIGRTEWNFNLPGEAKDVLAKTSAALGELKQATAGFLRAIGAELGAALSASGVRALAYVANMLPTCPCIDARLLSGAGAPALLKELARLIEHGRKRDEMRSALLLRYREEFLTLDHIAHLDRVTRAMKHPWIIRIFSGASARRKLRPYCNGAVPPLVTLQADLEKARYTKQLSQNLKEAPAAEAVGAVWHGGEAEWGQLAAMVAWSEQFHRAAEVLRREPGGPVLAERLVALAGSGEEIDAAKPSAAVLVKAWKVWSGAWDAAAELLAADAAEAFATAQGDREKAEPWLARVEETLTRWTSALPMLNDWCAWRTARDRAAGGGLGDLVTRFESGDLDRSELADAFERGFGDAWFTAVANDVPAIRQFNAPAHAQTIARFRRIDSELFSRARQTVAANLAARMPSVSAQASGQSEMGILKRELEKKRRHLPTRRLIEAMPTLLPRLKPCFLMSPLSVAQYLDPKLPPFDLVVFDEASQIPVWDSIGAIARGAEVIVVGDSKQLPPTTFFDTVDTEEEAEAEDLAVEDMESILKECNASEIPPMHLMWHYRSRHESLIAFSNHHYYENRLHTFPSPQQRSAELGVSFRHVGDGIYDRGNSRTNRREAELVVEEVLRLLTTDGKLDSIGIVTFNQAQQSLIEDLLDAKRRQLPQIERFFTTEVDEPVFVKNLENVQGDERDTVIFSVGYGPDASGRPSMNFGPINQDGGERRLNVAITRARRRLMVFSSLRSDQIDLRRTRALGVRHLKAFLDYAERGPQALAEAFGPSLARDFEAGFEQAVCKALRARGLEMDTQVGCAGYRVDLAVRDPEEPGRYLLGIECDGAAYNSAKTARDRDRLRHSVLEGLGWRLEHIWSTEWRINPQACVRRVLEAAEKARTAARGARDAPEKEDEAPAPEGPASVNEDDTSGGGIVRGPERAQPAGAGETRNRSVDQAGPSLQPDTNPSIASATTEATASSPHPVYRHARCDDRQLARSDIFDPRNNARAVAALARVVQVEAPIVPDLAMLRLAEWFGVKRITERYRRRLEQIVALAQQTQLLKLVDDALWLAGAQPEAFATFRAPGPDDEDRRNIEHIPRVERVNAMLFVLREQFGLPRADLVREAGRVLGLGRLTDRVRAALEGAVESAITSGRARSHGGSHVTLSTDSTPTRDPLGGEATEGVGGLAGPAA